MIFTRIHASQRGGEPLKSDAGTGEVRIPLSLYQLDDRLADCDLVLSRGEAEALTSALRTALAASNGPALEAV